jgi:hypothetical protein
MTTLDREVLIDTFQRVQLKPVKTGGVGRHDVPGLRGYRVMRFAHREQFVFSTLSAFVLNLIGSIHVATPGLRHIGAEDAPEAA